MQGSDLFELRRHAYSNSIDSYAIKKLVKLAFAVCLCKKESQEDVRTLPIRCETPPSLCETPPSSGPLPPRLCRGHEVAIPVEATVQELDTKEECVSTLLCYLELQGWLQVLNHTYSSCTLKCYGGARQLRTLARKVPAVAAAAARMREKGTPSSPLLPPLVPSSLPLFPPPSISPRTGV